MWSRHPNPTLTLTLTLALNPHPRPHPRPHPHPKPRPRPDQVDRAAAVRLWRRAIRGGLPGGLPASEVARGAGEAEGGASEVDLLAAQLLDAAAQAQGALLEAAWTEHGARGGREEEAWEGPWQEPWQESAPPAAVWRALPHARAPPPPPQQQPPQPAQEQEPQDMQQERMEAAEQAPPVHMLLPGAPFRNAGFRWRST